MLIFRAPVLYDTPSIELYGTGQRKQLLHHTAMLKDCVHDCCVQCCMNIDCNFCCYNDWLLHFDVIQMMTTSEIFNP